MKKALSTDLTPDNIARAVAFLSAAPDRLAALCADHSEPELRQPTGPGQRSVVEIIAHLLHSEDLTADAVKLALLGEEPLLADYHSERDFGRLYRYDRLPTADLLAYFRIRRAILLNVLTKLTPDQWARAIREEGKQRRESVYWRARTQVMHELDHLGEIELALGRG